VVARTMARLTEDRTARALVVDGSPPGWPHDAAMVSLMTFVTISGDVGEVQVYCQGGDSDPVLSVFTSPILRHCKVPLEEVGETLKTVLMDRVHIRELVEQGLEPPFVVGDWTWAIPSLDPAIPDPEAQDGDDCA